MGSRICTSICCPGSRALPASTGGLTWTSGRRPAGALPPRSALQSRPAVALVGRDRTCASSWPGRSSRGRGSGMPCWRAVVPGVPGGGPNACRHPRRSSYTSAYGKPRHAVILRCMRSAHGSDRAGRAANGHDAAQLGGPGPPGHGAEPRTAGAGVRRTTRRQRTAVPRAGPPGSRPGALEFGDRGRVLAIHGHRIGRPRSRGRSRCRVDDGPVPADRPGALQVAQPPMHGATLSADPLRELGDGEPNLGLKLGKDLPIDRIHSRRLLSHNSRYRVIDSATIFWAVPSVFLLYL